MIAIRTMPSKLVDGADRRLPTGRLRGVLLVILALIAAALVAALVVLVLRVVDNQRTEQTRQEAAGAVERLTPKLLNFDHRTLDADIARARSVTAGEYQKKNDRLAQSLRPTVSKLKGSTQTVVRSASVSEASADRASVLVYLDQTTNTAQLDAPRVDTRAAQVSVVYVDGSWRVEGFQPI